MERRLLEYLRQLVVAAQDSIEFVDGMSYEDFEDDTKTQRAVTMNLVILGEAAAKIEEHFPDFVATHPEIAWMAESDRPSVFHAELLDDLGDYRD